MVKEGRFYPKKHKKPLKNPFAQSATSLGVSPHHLRLAATSFTRSATSFICAEQMRNDVLALLEMMLTFGQMMLCLAAQMKKSKPIGLDFLAPRAGLEPATS